MSWRAQSTAALRCWSESLCRRPRPPTAPRPLPAAARSLSIIRRLPCLCTHTQHRARAPDAPAGRAGETATASRGRGVRTAPRGGVAGAGTQRTRSPFRAVPRDALRGGGGGDRSEGAGDAADGGAPRGGVGSSSSERSGRRPSTGDVGRRRTKTRQRRQTKARGARFGVLRGSCVRRTRTMRMTRHRSRSMATTPAPATAVQPAGTAVMRRCAPGVGGDAWTRDAGAVSGADEAASASAIAAALDESPIVFTDYQSQTFRLIDASASMPMATTQLPQHGERALYGGRIEDAFSSTRCERFIVKSTTVAEFRVLLALAPRYAACMCEPRRHVPCAHLRRPHTQDVPQQVLFPCDGECDARAALEPIQQLFDLKGSWVDRNTPPPRAGSTLPAATAIKNTCTTAT